MTVCLTGDVHHMSLDTRDQAYMERTEVECAIEYAEIAATYDVPVTLFVTGKAAREEPERVERLASMENVAIGGHNYYAFGTPIHKLFRGLTGSWNGPQRFQSWEVGRTLDALGDAGASVDAWRDHAYRYDEHTAGVLADHGLTHFSDAVGPEERVREEDGLTVVPINTPPDHEHVYHAFRTPEFVAADDFAGPFGAESSSIGEWLNWVLDSADERVRAGEPATVLSHPACMCLADGFAAFEDLCRALADRETIQLSSVAPSSEA